MTIRILIGQAREHLDEANGWAGALEVSPIVEAKPGGVDRKWDSRVEMQKRLRAARRLIDRALDEIGGGS